MQYRFGNLDTEKQNIIASEATLKKRIDKPLIALYFRETRKIYRMKTSFSKIVIDIGTSMRRTNLFRYFFLLDP